jgi:hypothetical protein
MSACPLSVRHWTKAHRTGDLLTSLAALEDAIATQRARR